MTHRGWNGHLFKLKVSTYLACSSSSICPTAVSSSTRKSCSPNNNVMLFKMEQMWFKMIVKIKIFSMQIEMASEGIFMFKLEYMFELETRMKCEMSLSKRYAPSNHSLILKIRLYKLRISIK